MTCGGSIVVERVLRSQLNLKAIRSSSGPDPVISLDVTNRNDSDAQVGPKRG